MIFSLSIRDWASAKVFMPKALSNCGISPCSTKCTSRQQGGKYDCSKSKPVTSGYQVWD